MRRNQDLVVPDQKYQQLEFFPGQPALLVPKRCVSGVKINAEIGGNEDVLVSSMFLNMCGTGSATPLRLARRGVILAAWSRLRGGRG